MKIIVAAKETQGQRADDFNFADESEIVIVADCNHLHHQIYALHEEQHSPKQMRPTSGGVQASTCSRNSTQFVAVPPV